MLRAAEAGQARADDSEILARAVSEGRILVTLDEHFGDWTVLPLREHPGVIRLRIHPPTTPAPAARIVSLLKAHSPGQFANHLLIVGAKRERWVRTA